MPRHTNDAIIEETHMDTMRLADVKALHAMGVPVGGNALTQEMRVLGYTMYDHPKSGKHKVAYRMKHGIVKSDDILADINPDLFIVYPDLLRPVLMNASIPRLMELLKWLVKNQPGIARIVLEVVKNRLQRVPQESRHSVRRGLSRIMALAQDKLQRRPWGVEDGQQIIPAIHHGGVLPLFPALLDAGADPFMKVVDGESCLEMLAVVPSSILHPIIRSITAAYLERNGSQKRVAVSRAYAKLLSLGHPDRVDTMAPLLLQHNPRIALAYKALLSAKSGRFLGNTERKARVRSLYQLKGLPGGKLDQAVHRLLFVNESLAHIPMNYLYQFL
jgi:hypothetical protein